MIEVSHVTKRFGPVTAVDDVSFTVGEGEVVGFLGPNGAGKTTTLRILTGFHPASSGTVRVAGLDVLGESLEVRRRLGYLPEVPPVYPDMRVEEFLRFRALLKGVARGRVRARVEEALERCGCADVRRRLIGGLSKGYRQRVGLADAIVHDPPILILDEPTSGLDPNQRLEVRALIRDIGRSKTVLLSSHILAEVEATAERVIVIHRGRVVADGTLEVLARRLGDAHVVVVETDLPLERALEAARSVEGVEDARGRLLEDGWSRVEARFPAGQDARQRTAEAVLEAGGRLRELTSPTPTLEDLFHMLTGGEGKAA